MSITTTTSATTLITPNNNFFFDLMQKVASTIVNEGANKARVDARDGMVKLFEEALQKANNGGMEIHLCEHQTKFGLHGVYAHNKVGNKWFCRGDHTYKAEERLAKEEGRAITRKRKERSDKGRKRGTKKVHFESESEAESDYESERETQKEGSKENPLPVPGVSAPPTTPAPQNSLALVPPVISVPPNTTVNQFSVATTSPPIWTLRRRSYPEKEKNVNVDDPNLSSVETTPNPSPSKPKPGEDDEFEGLARLYDEQPMQTTP